MIMLNPIEALWITINLATAILTVAALVEARRDWAALKRFNGSTRGVVARANIRAEWIRLAIQVAMLVVVIPAVFSDRELELTLPLLIFLTVPVLLLVNTLNARRVRDVIGDKLEDEIKHERDASLVRMEARLNVRADERAGIVTARAVDIAEQTNHIAEVAEDVQAKVTDIVERTA